MEEKSDEIISVFEMADRNAYRSPQMKFAVCISDDGEDVGIHEDVAGGNAFWKGYTTITTFCYEGYNILADWWFEGMDGSDVLSYLVSNGYCSSDDAVELRTASEEREEDVWDVFREFDPVGYHRLLEDVIKEAVTSPDAKQAYWDRFTAAVEAMEEQEQFETWADDIAAEH